MAYNNSENNPDILINSKATFVVVFIILCLLLYIISTQRYLPHVAATPPVSITIQNPAPSNSTPAQTNAASPGATPSDSQPVGATQKVETSFLVSGRIAQMNFPENAQVKKGDVLASLDKAPFEQDLANVKAQMQNIQSDHEQSGALPNPNFQAIEAARAHIEAAQHTYDVAHAELVKRRKMQVASMTDNVYDNDVQSEHDAQVDLDKAKRELVQQEAVGRAAMNADTHPSTLQKARNNMAVAETNLAATQLIAPADGVVVGRNNDVGDIVMPGTVIYTLSVTKQ